MGGPDRHRGGDPPGGNSICQLQAAHVKPNLAINSDICSVHQPHPITSATIKSLPEPKFWHFLDTLFEPCKHHIGTLKQTLTFCNLSPHWRVCDRDPRLNWGHVREHGLSGSQVPSRYPPETQKTLTKLAWPVLTWPFLFWPAPNSFTCPEWTCPDLTCPDLPYPDLICPALTCPDLTCSDFTRPDSRHPYIYRAFSSGRN